MNAEVSGHHHSMRIEIDKIKALEAERYDEVHDKNMIWFNFSTKLCIHCDDIINEKDDPNNLNDCDEENAFT